MDTSITERIEEASSLQLLLKFFDERYESITQWTLTQFDREMLRYSRTLLLLLSLLLVEGLMTGFLLLYHGVCLLLGVMLALLFLTTFSSFIIVIYLSAVRTHRQVELQEQLLQALRQHLNYAEGNLNHHFTLAEMISRMLSHLEGREGSYLPPVPLLGMWPPRLSSWLHRREVYQFQRRLIESVIDESLTMVRYAPLDLDVHANLASAYHLMASLQHATPKEFPHFAYKAIDELNIIKTLAPDEPWVYIQLAYSFHDLKDREKEIHAYEQLLRLQPDDLQSAFRLGLLYFQQGFNAEGLAIYERLRSSGYPHAATLISFYGKGPTP